MEKSGKAKKDEQEEIIRSIQVVRPDLNFTYPNFSKMFESYNLSAAVMASLGEQLADISKMASKSLASSVEPIINARKDMIKSMQGILASATLSYPALPTTQELAPKEKVIILPEEIIKPEAGSIVEHDQAERIVDLSIRKDFIFPSLVEYRDGDIYFNDKLIDFRPRNNLQQLLVEALIIESDPSGFCSYQTLDSYFVKKGKRRITNHYEKIKRVNNALQSLYRSHKRRVLFPKKAPDGHPIIRVYDGEGFGFHNPKQMNYVFVLRDGKQEKIIVNPKIN